MRGGTTPAGMVMGKADKDGGTIYRYAKHGGGSAGRVAGKRAARPAAVTVPTPAKFADTMTALQAAMTPALLEELAKATGVPATAWAKVLPGWADAAALRAMRAGGAGWETGRPDGAWAIPEHGGDGGMVGASLRARDGRKGSPSAAVGAKRGLVVPTGFHDMAGPVLIVEGASDVAACVAMDLAAVGRPSNRGGAEDLSKLLDGLAVFVVGENDAKPGGAWPGRDGAKAVATRLAGAWGGAVAWTLPPRDAKDIRHWLGNKIAGGLDVNNADAMKAAGRELMAALEANKHAAKADKRNASDRLVELAMERYRLGVTGTGDAFAVANNGPMVAMLFRGGRDGLRNKLSKDYREATNRTPAASALVDALTALEGMAADMDPEPVALRLATLPDAGGVVIDMADASGRAALLTPTGWTVEERSPVLFRRTALTGQFPTPAESGDLAKLRELLNVHDDAWPLLVGWLVAACLPDIPHPVLMLGGEQGTGKSTAAELLAGLVDPSPAPLRGQPRDEEGWATMASGSWVVVIDNVSGISQWFSDALCKAVTGDGMVKRRLYTDNELAVVSFRRCVVLTSIDAGALRGDLGDRLLLVDLERIPDTQRRTEAELKQAWRDALPGLLAGLYDVVARVLAALPTITLKRMPRMADFAKVLAAVDKAAPALTGGKALETFMAQRERIAGDVVDADPVAAAVVKLLEAGDWTGTAGELLAKITPTDNEGNPRAPRGWPGAGNTLSGRLKRMTPALRLLGIAVEQNRDTDSKRTKMIVLRKGAQPIVQTVQNATSDGAAGEGELDDADDADDEIPPTSPGREGVVI